MANNERFLNWQAKMTERKGSRQSFNLQLDWDDPDDVELIKIIALLKDKQDFSKVMRLALKIIPALMYEGNLDELFLAFAWVKLEMLEYLKELQTESEPASNGNTASKDDIARLERLILQQSSPVVTTTNGHSNGGLKALMAQPKQLDVPRFEKPDFEDDEDEPLMAVKKNENAGKQATENFLKSAFALQQ